MTESTFKNNVVEHLGQREYPFYKETVLNLANNLYCADSFSKKGNVTHPQKSFMR